MRIPLSTYRIQFNIGFRFADARDLVPYLHALGITELYSSPRFKARRGSAHGYDVTDPRRISSELGTEEEFREMVARLHSYGMGLVLDIVPNHMAASAENPWWMDVLENGPSSDYAEYFDIDWHPATTKAAFLQENRVLLPVLGDLYGVVLENQELSLRLDENGFYVRYYEHRFPVDPRSYAVVLDELERALGESGGAALSAEAAAELAEIRRLVAALPHYAETGAEARPRRRRDARAVKDRLWRLYSGSGELRQAADEVLRRFGGARGNPRSFDLLDGLLSAQPYRLAHWKIGMEEINYRRFFDVNDLVGLRVESPRVFADRHVRVLQLVHEGSATGLRVDHVDGLFDPQEYLERLQREAAPGGEGVYVVVEKILGERESLPEGWPVAGTTGYDFLNAVNALFLDPAGLAALEQGYARFTGSALPFSEVCYAGNKKAMEQLFAGEVQALTHHLARLAAQDRHARDIPLYEMVQLLVEVTSCLPVYRTYIRDFSVSERDRFYIEKTLELARSRVPASRVSDAALAFLRQVLLLEPPVYAAAQLGEYLAFVRRWQQFTGPVMAKGLEDTASYVHNSLVSLNEVGGDPLRESLPLDTEAFHLFLQDRRERAPHSLNATSTHDTKRSEDVRARINVLSELAEEWEAGLQRWSRWNASRRRVVGGHAAPAAHEEVLLYQTLAGVWPLDEAELPALPERLKAYMVKAAREAKVHTSWMDPDERHEAALRDFVDALLAPGAQNRFLRDFLRFQKKIAWYGAFNALSQTLLKIAAPGVPDFYQGCELWDFSLVDPDNRRPVDFARRIQRFEQVQAAAAERLEALPAELLAHWTDGRIKMYVIWRALELRKSLPGLFLEGEYLPLGTSGAGKECACALARRHNGQWAVAVVPRLLTRLVEPGKEPLGGAWGHTLVVLPADAPREWRNVFTGETLRARSAGPRRTLRLAEVLRKFPLALLSA